MTNSDQMLLGLFVLGAIWSFAMVILYERHLEREQVRLEELRPPPRAGRYLTAAEIEQEAQNRHLGVG